MTPSGHLVNVWVQGQIRLSPDEIENAGGSLVQAAQNILGSAGLVVFKAEDEDRLGEREPA